MRLESARAYVKTLISDGLSPMGMNTSLTSNNQEVRIQAQVKGLGPRFLLSIQLQNVGQTPILGTRLMFSFDSSLYSFGYGGPGLKPRQCIPVPILLPGPKHVFEAELLSTDPQGRAGQVLVLLGNNTSSVPIIAATVRMPVSEPAISF